MRNPPTNKIPHLLTKAGRWYWEPTRDLRPTFSTVALGTDADRARAEARRLNRQAENWRRANPTTPKRRTDTPLSVAELAEAFRQSRDFSALRASTRKQYRYEIDRLTAAFGHSPIETLRAADVDDWRDSMIDQAPQTLRHVSARGRQIFEWGARKGRLKRPDNPFARLDVPGGKKRSFFFSWPDIKHVATVAAEEGRPSLGAALVLGFLTIQRITDVLALTKEAVTIEGRQRSLRFRQSKTGFAVDQEWPAEADRWLALQKIPEKADHLIISEAIGRPYGRFDAARAFSRILAEAIARDPERWSHLVGGQLRDCRRSGFVHAYQHGADVPQICSMSGHSLNEGYAIIEHYLPKTRSLADRARAAMRKGLT